MPNTERHIRSANTNDIPAIIAIMEQHFIHQKAAMDKDTLESVGFLIHGFSESDIREAIADEKNHIVLVATENDAVIGYVLNYDLKKLNDWMVDLQSTSEYLAILTGKKVFYHRHIAKIPHKKGVGKKLLQSLMNEAVLRNYDYIVCQILQKPYQNRASVKLHEALGFFQIGVVEEEEYTFGVYLKAM